MANKKGSYRKYKDTYPKEMLDMMREGALDCQIAAKFKISGHTFSDWCTNIEDFKEAHDEGMPACESWWIEQGKKGMMGTVKGFNAMTWIMFMNNKFRNDGWSKTGGEPAASQTININQMNVLQSKDRVGLLDYIKRVVDKNKDIIDLQLIESVPNGSEQPSRLE